MRALLYECGSARARAHALALALLTAAAAPSLARAAPGEFLEDDVEVLHVLEGASPGENFGWAVAELADVDGDGAMDVLVGAPFNSEIGPNGGRTYVHSGATGELLRSFTGAPGELHGYAIADAGDVDGDGTTDIVAGAPGAGRVYVYSGDADQLLHTLTSDSEGMLGVGFFGGAVSGAGDVDGDGHDDILVGAPAFPSAGAAGGRAYLFSGATGDPLWTFDAAQDDAKLGSAVASLGDVTGDGVPDALVGARDDGSDARGRVYVISGADGLVVDPIIEADETGTDLAWFFVGELGDLDGDGLPEIYAGDFENTALGPSTGRAYVYSGATHEPLFVFTGEQAGDGLGPGRRGGDIDQDGVPDIVACSYSSSLGAMNAGQASIFSGADGARLRTITSTRVGETLGFDAVTLGDVNGDGVDDLVVSGASLDVAYIISGATQTPGETGTTTGEPGATTGDDTSAGSETDATTTTGTGASTGAGGSTTAGDTSGTTAETTAGTSASDSGGEDDGGGQGCACEVAASRLWGECALVWSVLLLLLAWRPRARRSR